MTLHYLEIVTAEVEAVCAAYSAALGVAFGEPDPQLGQARTAPLPDGSRIGVRAPMSATEQPLVRPYWRVPDIHAAVAAAEASGALVAHPPLELPGQGSFAILIRGDTQHGLWQL